MTMTKKTTTMFRRAALAAAVCSAPLVLGCEDEPVPTRPSVADANDWCEEHALPESMCAKCNPELAARFQEAGDWCSGHGQPESVCPLCHPMEPPPGMQKLPGAGEHQHDESHAEPRSEG